MRLLMHICCSNCAVYPVKKLRADGIEVAALWFNPNIHPEQEYESRLASVKKLQDSWLLDVLYRDLYGLNDFLRGVGEDTVFGKRCVACYRMRLDRSAREAKEQGFDAFTTSLLVSPYQRFDLILEEAGKAGERYDIEFHFEDFRAGFREGMSISRELGLYRQKYCGCLFSKAERSVKAG